MNEQKEELIDGYTVISSIWIGNKRLIYAKDKSGKRELPYMKCIYQGNGILGQYADAVVSDTFEEILKLYADDIKAEALILESNNRVEDSRADACLRREDLSPAPENKRLVGEIVAIQPKYLSDGYQNIRHQLYYITGGSGAEANSRGTTCFCRELYDGENDSIKRFMIAGIVPAEKLPDFAKRTLNSIKKAEKEKQHDER